MSVPLSSAVLLMELAGRSVACEQLCGSGCPVPTSAHPFLQQSASTPQNAAVVQRELGLCSEAWMEGPILAASWCAAFGHAASPCGLGLLSL